MSANNFISIEGKGKRYEVWVRDADTGDGYSEGIFDTQAQAIIKAQEIQTVEPVEYGVRFNIGEREE